MVDDPFQVVAHGLARGGRIAGLEGLEHPAVLDDPGLQPHAPGAGQDVAGQGRAVAPVPQVLDGGDDRAVPGGAGDDHVELAVGVLALDLFLAGHAPHQSLQFEDLVFGDGGGGQGGGLALEQAAGFDQLEGPDVGRRLGTGRGDGAHVAGHIDAQAVAGLDHAQHFQGDHRLAQGGAADPVLLGQFAFGGQAIAELVLAALDRLGDGVGYSAIELDVLGHGSSSVSRRRARAPQSRDSIADLARAGQF